MPITIADVKSSGLILTKIIYIISIECRVIWNFDIDLRFFRFLFADNYILEQEILGNLNINTGTTLLLKTIVNKLKSN